MTVRAEETGDERLAGQVYHFRFAAPVQLFYIGIEAYRHDITVFHGDGFRGWLSVIDGNDGAAKVNRVGRHALIRAAWTASRANEQQKRANYRSCLTSHRISPR